MRYCRQEATGIPNLLVAPKQDVESTDDSYEDGVGDYSGYYEDGAYYTSDPAPANEDDVKEGEVGVDPQMAYFDSILTRFEVLRDQLAQTPPPEVVDKLGKDQPTHVGPLNSKVAKWWRWHMRTTDPLPAQIASMDKSTVLRLLGVLTSGTSLKSGIVVDLAVSRWVWGLLARLPERGELNSEEIGVVRELGKKAVLVGMGLREDEQWQDGLDEVEAAYEEAGESGEGKSYSNEEEIQLEIDEDLDGYSNSPEITTAAPQIGPQLPSPPSEVADPQDLMETAPSISIDKPINGDLEVGDGPSTGTELADDLATAKARILASISGEEEKDCAQQSEVGATRDPEAQTKDGQADSEPSKWNTKATVDMIITVAGEMFGQRDLLEFRSVWGEVL